MHNNERYTRNLLCEGFSPETQRTLSQASVLVVGSGGLGSYVLPQLAAAGVGHITIVEFDSVSISNLNRQVLFTTEQIGRSKAKCAAERLRALNPEIEISIIEQRITEENAEGIFLSSAAQIIVDCTDNFEARYAIDNACAKLGLPFVHASVEGYKGCISVFHGGKAGAYKDLFGDDLQTSAAVGVLAPVVGTIASLQASEVLKIITQSGDILYNKLLVINILNSQFTLLEI